MALVGIILLKGGVALAILWLLFTFLRYFSGKGQIAAVMALERYFRGNVFPRKELASRWQGLRLQNTFLCKPVRQKPGKGEEQPGTYSRADTWEQVEEELESPYYLRTGQRVKQIGAQQPLTGWYGEEAWIRDILADRFSWRIVCQPLRMAGRTPPASETQQTGKTGAAEKPKEKTASESGDAAEEVPGIRIKLTGLTPSESRKEKTKPESSNAGEEVPGTRIKLTGLTPSGGSPKA